MSLKLHPFYILLTLLLSISHVKSLNIIDNINSNFNFMHFTSPAGDLVEVNKNANPSVLQIGIVKRPIFICNTTPVDAAVLLSAPVHSKTHFVTIWTTLIIDIFKHTLIKTLPPHLAIVNFLVLLFLFPGLVFLLPNSRRLIKKAIGIIICLSSITIGILLFKTEHYIWNSSSHLLALIFLFLWLKINSKYLPLLFRASAQLEPIELTGTDTLPPPTDRHKLKLLPSTDAMAFTINPDITSNKVVPDCSNIELANGKIIRLIGSGGMADVFLIWNDHMEIYRAVKVLKPNKSPELLRCFETEIRIFSKLNHQNIIHCYSIGEWNNLPFCEMEYVNGLSFSEILKKCKLLSVEQALVIGILICRALHYIHNQVITIYGKTYKGIIHQDIKPANIMLSRSGQIKLTDFGIASPGSVIINTDTNAVLGTLAYIAPEHLENKNITHQTDVYMLGVTLYELLTGNKAFPQTQISKLIDAKLAETYAPLQDTIKIDKSVSDIIEKAMSTSPIKRFLSARQFGETLENLLYTNFDIKKSNLLSLVQKLWNEKCF